MLLTIHGARHYLWRAVDQDGHVLDLGVAAYGPWQPHCGSQEAKAAFGKGQGMRRDVSNVLAWACLVTGLLAVLIVVGSCRLSRFDPALMAYTCASLFAVFGIPGRYAVWLQRPLTARFWKRGWPVFFRRGHRGRNLGLWGKRVTGEGMPHTSDPVM